MLQTRLGIIVVGAAVAIIAADTLSSLSSSLNGGRAAGGGGLIVAVSALTAEWIQLHPPSSQRVTPRRSGHAAFVLANKTPYLFGGYVEVSSSTQNPHDGDNAKSSKYDRYVVNDLWKWESKNRSDSGDADVDTMGGTLPGWTLVQCSGDIPGPRLATAMAVSADNRKAYLLGGWDPQTAGTGGIILDTVHCLDLATHQWRQLDPSSSNIPGGPTSRHVAVTLPTRTGNSNNSNKILLHNHRCNDFVWLLDTTTERWEQQPTTGPCPSPRGLHVACMLDDTRLLLFGGAAQDQTMSNEAFLLDTVTWEWTRLDSRDNKDGPSPRASPCLARINEHCVVVWGGAEYDSAMGLKPRSDLWALDVKQREWTCLQNDDDDDGRVVVLPPPRNAATLTEISSSNMDSEDDAKDGVRSFLLTGGWAPFRETWDDCFVLKIRE